MTQKIRRSLVADENTFKKIKLLSAITGQTQGETLGNAIDIAINQLKEFTGHTDMETNQHKPLITRIEQLEQPINWTHVSLYENLSENFIRTHQDKVDWNAILEGNRFSESFLIEFQDRLDWTDITMNQVLSEQFMEKFQDKIDWKFIASTQKLSESFIRKFQDKLDWDDIKYHQILSDDFKQEFREKLEQCSDSILDLKTFFASI